MLVGGGEDLDLPPLLKQAKHPPFFFEATGAAAGAGEGDGEEATVLLREEDPEMRV